MIQTSWQQGCQDKKQKTQEDYSRNVKKLKFKIQKIRQQIISYEQKLQKMTHTSNDQIIAMKISKFCKQRKLTPEMLFRFADSKNKNLVTRMEFRNTLVGIGLKLAQEQLTRLEYLLDEDIKGDISLLEYSKYLHAFGLKTEHDPNDPFVKQTLKDIDFNKLLEIAKEDNNKHKKQQGDRILLNYDQFLKYCHKNFPQTKDKQLAKIFKKLQHNQRIDLEDLIEYLQNLRKQKKRFEEKNSPNKKKPEDEEKKKKKLTLEDEDQMIDITTLKGKLMAVFKDHPQKQQTFHSSEFRRVQNNYNLEKGSMLRLFRQMDVKLVGSIGFNDVIGFYVEQETYKPNNNFLVKYSFILMGQKLLAVGQKPEALVAAFVKEDIFITGEEFGKMCQVEFGLKEDMATKLYQVILQCPGHKLKQNCVNTSLLISLMKVNRQVGKNTVRPILQSEDKKFLHKKHHQTICTNGIVAYKICESIVGQLAMSEKYEKWDDFEFGPSAEDEVGLDSIGTHIANPNVRWHSATALSIAQFYISGNKDEPLYSVSSMCPHDLFHKSLQMLIKHDQKYLYRTLNEIAKHNKKVEQSQLLKLFEGLYPLAFHRFKQRGIYVIQFFFKGKWLYVIVDDKLPCNQQDEPLFARPGKAGCAIVPIVEKAYAKLRGAYQKVFESPSMAKYLNQLASSLIVLKPINEKDNSEELERVLLSGCSMEVRKKQLEKRKQLKQTFTEMYLANLSLGDKKPRQKQKSGLPLNTLSQIHFSTTIKDPQNSTQYQLTFLTYCFQANAKWNSKWSQSSGLFRRLQPSVKAEVNNWDSQNETTKIFRNGKLETVVVDNEIIQETWNTVVEIVNFRFDDCGVLLRKELEFERGYGCLYKVNSTDKTHNVKLVVVVNRIRAPNDAKVLVTLKPTPSSKEPFQASQPLQSHSIKGQFGCLSFSIPQLQHELQLKIQKFDPQQQYAYQLSFYFDHPRYSLKERDRHLLFRYVSQYEERTRLQFDMLTETQKKYFYENFFLNANRKGFLCC